MFPEVAASWSVIFIGNSDTRVCPQLQAEPAFETWVTDSTEYV
jgi:hypothetical protein